MSEAVVSLHDFFSMDEVKLEGFDGSKFEASEAYRKMKAVAGSVTWNSIRGGIGNEVGQLLKGISLIKILETAWSKSQEIQKYLDPASNPPDKSAYVTLAKHDISSVQKPSLKVVLIVSATGIKHTFEIPLEISLKVNLEGVVLEFKAGQLKSIQSATCKGKGEIKVAGAELYKAETRSFKLPGNWQFSN